MKIATFLGVLTVAAAISGPAFAQAESAKIDDCVVTGAPGSIALKTVEPDTLIVGTVLPNPGWFNGNSPTSIKDGFEYCMAAEIAHRAGLKSVRLMNLAWDQHISGTVKGYDVAIASTTITPQRQMVFDFSQPYFGSNLGVAIKAGSDVTAENLRQKRIGVLQGNMGAEWVVKTLQPEVKPALFQAQPDMLTALMAGQIDAIVSDTTIVLSMTSGANGSLAVVGQYEMNQGYGIITPKGSENSPAIDSAVGAMKADGTLKRLSETYLSPLFGADPNSVPVWKLQ